MSRHSLVSGGDQNPLKSDVSPTNWFTVGFEVEAGKSAKWFGNGKQIGTIPAETVTTAEHRLVLQNEDDDGNATEELLVQYNWLRVHTYVVAARRAFSFLQRAGPTPSRLRQAEARGARP